MTKLASSDLNILLVEPSTMQRKVIRKELSEENIESIDEAETVKSALKRISMVKPDLVISSLYLPDGSAMDIVNHIRKNPETADLPFMLISSETRHCELDKFKQSGVIAILPKPFSHDHLTTAINSTLDILSDDELELDYYDPETLRVLVVDDSKMARKVIINVLTNLGINNITQAADGSDAIELLPQGFDVIITDYNMPEVNGLQLAEHVRSSQEYSHLPILMVTSESTHAHLSNVAKSGVNAMADKPFEPSTIKQLLTKILDE
ncbi:MULTISPECIES: response regulator [unclassified Neptuniibacter]|uniref:response regulator n=1 Tax=unclassified Neptuniibacter TaxID=2630693 RepID=UPI000C5F534C|nr:MULTISPECIES: response regulator [unclassified Neptuniibacter]MAY42443.1 two-component system response regulator [Oceanospirillaceae bacterium]|tara:strand:+ start:3832 stop:4626 length:795 start_codon:yes stop_codon:yes gene_type:complete